MNDIKDNDVAFLYYIVIMIFVGIAWLLTTEGKYLTKDIRVNDEVQYNEVEYGKVDSIAYYVNGKLIQYNQVNKLH